MKKLITILLVLFCFLVQAGAPGRIVRYPNATTQFGEIISIGTKIINTETGKEYTSLQALISTKTIATCSLVTELKEGGDITGVGTGTATGLQGGATYGDVALSTWFMSLPIDATAALTDYVPWTVSSSQIDKKMLLSTLKTLVGGGGSGTVTSVTAGNGLTQAGTATINPTLNIVSHAGTAGSIGTVDVGPDAIGVNLGITSTVAFRGDYGNTAYTNMGKVLINGGSTYAPLSASNFDIVSGIVYPIISDVIQNTSYMPITSNAVYDALAGKQNSLTLTTTGSSGAATLVGATLNIPQYAGGGSMTYPGAGIPISTGSAWGTSITNASTNWNTAYTNRISTFTTTGSGAATLSGNVLNIPTYSLPAATTGALGGVALNFTATGAAVPLQISSNNAFVTLTKTAIESGAVILPYTAGYTIDLNVSTNASYTATGNLNITFSNLVSGRTGNIEIIYTGTGNINFYATGYTFYIAPNIKAGSYSVLAQSSGNSMLSYYVSGTNIYINGQHY